MLNLLLVQTIPGSPIHYANWAPGQPLGVIYDCAVMDLSHQGLWFDTNCADRHQLLQNMPGHHYFICQYRECLMID
jgi:hypothetical protein